jgi:hypothetical protein
MPTRRCHRASRCGARCGAHADTKTERSRRTLALPAMAVAALRELRVHQADDRAQAGGLWQESGLVFTTRTGTPLSAGHVRRMFPARRLASSAEMPSRLMPMAGPGTPPGALW